MSHVWLPTFPPTLTTWVLQDKCTNGDWCLEGLSNNALSNKDDCIGPYVTNYDIDHVHNRCSDAEAFNMEIMRFLL